MNLTDLEWRFFSASVLKEDAADRDITSLLLLDENCRVRGSIIADESAVICGLKGAEACFRLLDPEVHFVAFKKDGDEVSAGEAVAEVEGRAKALLAAERSALNILAHLSGIATATRNFVRSASKHGIEVYDTRKTRPLLRKVEKYAANVGGAKNHRLSLDEAVFVKDNHKLVAGGMERVLKMLQKNREKIASLPLIIEVENLDELELAASVKPDLILLDNFSPDDIKAAQEKFGGVVEMEISGGITADSLYRLAQLGVRRVSSSSFIMRAQACMFKFEVKQQVEDEK